MDKWIRKVTVALTLMASFLAFGTIFYHYAEGWRYIDAFYFSGITLTTVGYGEFVPTHDLSKVVTVFFALSGIGIVFYSIGIIAQKYFEREEERLQKIWETARTVHQNAKRSNVRISEGKIAEVTAGTKEALLKSAKRDKERTAMLLKRKSRG